MPANNTPLPSSFDGDTDFYEENRWQKLSRKIREEPLIPLGIAATCAALYGASRSIRAGDSQRTNRMFRYRIYGQAFTIIAMVAGGKYWEGDRKKRKEFEEALAEKKAKERSEAWLRELEARDEEEKELQAFKEKRRQANAAAAAAASVPVVKEPQKADVRDLEAEKQVKKSRVLDAVATIGKK